MAYPAIQVLFNPHQVYGQTQGSHAVFSLPQISLIHNRIGPLKFLPAKAPHDTDSTPIVPLLLALKAS
jgi:hypothetical protein